MIFTTYMIFMKGPGTLQGLAKFDTGFWVPGVAAQGSECAAAAEILKVTEVAHAEIVEEL